MHKYTMFAADCGKVIRSKLWLKFSEKVIKVSTLAPSFGEVDTNVNIWRLVGKITCQAVPTFKNQNDNVGRPIGHVTCLKPRLKFSLTVNLGRPLGSVTLNTKTSRCEDWLAKFWRLQAVPNLKLENQKTMFADRLECHLLEALVEILKQPMSEDHLAVSLAPSQTLV